MKIHKYIIIFAITFFVMALNGCNKSRSDNHVIKGTQSVETPNTSNISSTPQNGNNKQESIKEVSLAKEWKYSGIKYQCKPVITEKSIIAVAENMLLKIDKETGNKDIEIFLNANYTGNFYFDNNIIASCNTQGILEVIDINSGNILWGYGIPTQIYCKPAVKDEILYAVSTNGILYAIDIKTGNELWELNPDNGTFFNQYNEPIIIGETLYFITGQNGRLYAVDLKTKQEKWHIKDLGLNEVYLKNVLNRIYAVSKDGIVCAIDAEEGMLIWKKDFGGNGKNSNFIFSAIDNECLTIFNLDKHIYRIDLFSGDLTLDYMYEGNGKISDVIEVVDTLFFVVDDDIKSIDLKGNNYKAFNLVIPMGGKISAEGNKLYVTSTDGKLYKYKLLSQNK